MRHRPRTDSNQTAIVQALRDCGCQVLSLAAIGKGCPDLLVGTPCGLVLVEVKDGDKPPSKRKLTKDERAARRNQCLTGVFINRKQLRRLLHGKGMRVPKPYSDEILCLELTVDKGE